MLIIDKLAYTSKLKTVNASLKFAFSMITLLICVMSRSIVIAFVVFFSMGILSVLKGGIPLSRYIRLLTIPIVFILFSMFAIIVEVNELPLSKVAIACGSFYLTLSTQGVEEGIRLFCTALSSVSCLYFLMLSTPMTEIIMVLKKLHCPHLLLELMLLIYRFIFILLELANNLRIAQECRLGNKTFSLRIKSIGMLMSTLFIRAFQRSNRLFDAMESRGYDGEICILMKEQPVNKKAVAYVVFYEFSLLIYYIIVCL